MQCKRFVADKSRGQNIKVISGDKNCCAENRYRVWRQYVFLLSVCVHTKPHLANISLIIPKPFEAFNTALVLTPALHVNSWTISFRQSLRIEHPGAA